MNPLTVFEGLGHGDRISHDAVQRRPIRIRAYDRRRRDRERRGLNPADVAEGLLG
jgi:hypothetical protein